MRSSLPQILKDEFDSFLKYLSFNKKIVYFIVFMAVFSYGFPLTQFTLSIDEEKALFAKSNLSLWSEQGRFGIALFKILFHFFQTNSITATFLGISSLCLSGLIWAYTFSAYTPNIGKPRKSDLSAIVFVALFISFPGYAEIIGFSIMSFEVGLGWVLIAVATHLISKMILYEGSRWYGIIGILSFILSISIYQAFFTVFICGTAAVFILFLYFNKESAYNYKNYLVSILRYIFVTVICFALYKFVDTVIGQFIPSSGYISGFLAWGEEPFKQIIVNLTVSTKSLWLGETIYGGKIIPFSLAAAILVFLLILYRSFFRNEKKNYLLILISLFGFVVSPFLMPIILGTPLPIRTHLALILFISFIWYLLYYTFEKKLFRYLIVLFGLFMSINQAQSVSQLFYSDFNRYQEDVKLAHQIGYQIQELNIGETPNQPVVFIGSHARKKQDNIIKQEVLGYSFFEWDSGNPTRMMNFMKSLGYNYFAPTEEQRKLALHYSNEMPVWPYRGSVALVEDLIIVNLSENPEKYNLNLFNNEERKDKQQYEYVENGELNKTNIDFLYDIQISESRTNELKFHSGTSDPQVSFLVDRKLNVEAFNYIVMEFYSDIDGTAQIFLREEGGSYGAKFNGTIEVKKGHNLVFCEKQPYMKDINAIRIDPPNNSMIEIIKLGFSK